jgi:molecular chaperone DnaK
MGRAIGIDLGTTNTAVAVLDGGRPRVLEDSKGYMVLPSVVWIGDSGETVVGQAAKNLLLTDPERTAYAVKRVLGRHFDSDEVADARRKVGYEIVEAQDGSCLIEMAQGNISPVELSAHVLRTAKQMAERALGEEVDEAVITVPAYFNHAQRAATMEAAQLAGLHCERLLNEPTAAALAYGFKREIDRTLLVFDLGGGTFDVSVLRLSTGVYEILATLGDSYLGGEDFDYRIVDHLAEAFIGAHGVDLREDRTTLHRLKDAAERAKCELSFTDRTTVLIPQIAAGVGLERVLDRTTLEGLVEDYVERAMAVTQQAVSDSGLKISDIDEVILVGGQTRMPRIRGAIAAMFDKEPSRSVHPEEVVAIGAAVHAASLADDDITPAVLIDVTPFDLGIDVAGGMFQPIIQRNSTIPTSAARIFATAQAQQDSVKITVRQGASRMAEDNEFLGEFIMGGLTPAPRMETKVEVNFKLDANGMLHVTAMEPATGKTTEITVRNYAEVAQSKGEVKPKLSGIGTVPTEPSPQADATAPEPAGPAKSKAKRAKKAAKPKSGGLLSALFGRVQKKRTKPAPPAATLPDTPEEPSIIEAVAAERVAADAQESDVPSDVEPELLEELDAAALQTIEPEPLDVMDQPLFESRSPEPTAGIVLPELEMEALEFLDSEGLELDPFTEEVDAEPLLVDLSEADLFDADDDLDDDLSDLIGDEADDDFSDLGPPPEMVGLGEADLEALDDDEQSGSPVGFFHDDELDAAMAEAEEAGEAEPEEDEPEDDLSDLIGNDTIFDDDGGVGGPPVGFMGIETNEQDVDDRDPDAPEGGRVDFDAGLFEFARLDAEKTSTEAIPEAPTGFDDEPTEQLRDPVKKKPAKLKLSYKNPAAVVREYRENLERGGCFVKTAKPLAVDREVRIEVRISGIDEPIVIPGVVTWSSRHTAELEAGQEAGMGIEYQLDADERAHVVALLDVLSG